MDAGWPIGELARRGGVTAKTVRYYELLGLLCRARRTAAGYRLFGPEDLERLAFIGKAQGLGLSLAEIRDIVRLAAQGASPCERVADLLNCHIAALDQRIRELRALRRALAALQVGAARRRPRGVLCGIIESGPPAECPEARARGARVARRAERWVAGRPAGRLASAPDWAGAGALGVTIPGGSRSAR